MTRETSRAYRAVFFDLDGTLLPMELEEFLSAYFKALGGFVASRGYDGVAFSKALGAGTKGMTKCDDDRLNAEVFWDVFFEHMGESASLACREGEDASLAAEDKVAQWSAMLDDFYENEFGKIGEQVTPNPAAARAIEALAAKGYPLVLATMPMFPLRAVQWRLQWAGVDATRFTRLTHYENSTATKPKLSYYAENLAACGVRGEDILMVGNNTVEDLAAMGLGCDAFLVTDHLIDPVGFDLSRVKHGTMEEFAAWADSLPPCENPVRDIQPGPVSGQARAASLEECASAEAHARIEAVRAAAEAVNFNAVKASI
ncbi:MAG: HAD family hydrolase [Eggerthellaceae bacterium]|nr:HAD family hydrolase [Eggerthellaceae bacterium]